MFAVKSAASGQRSKMTRLDFKIIVDLSQVYQDARQSTLVYIDSSKIWHIKQLQEHLIELFHIPEPFHLLSTGTTYLPPNEDVRILAQNDVVKVMPGTGFIDQSLSNLWNHQKQLITTSNNQLDNIKNYVGSNPISTGSSNNGSMYVNVTNNSLSSKESNSEEGPKFKTYNDISQFSKPSNQTNVSLPETTTNRTIYHSILNDMTEIDSSSKLEEYNSTKDSTGTDEQNVSKKKRIRHRKKKNTSSDQDMSIAKKPRIVSNVPLSTVKHIRFDAPDIESDVTNVEAYISESVHKTPAKHFDKLLALRQTSTPLVFEHSKKDIVNVKDNTNSQSEALEKSSNESSDKTMDVEPSTEIEKGVHVKVGDVVDFKILKMASDYTPVISETITAEVIQISPDLQSYELKITSGKNEIEAPNGKFALPDDSNLTELNTIVYDRKDLLELKIVKSV